LTELKARRGGLLGYLSTTAPAVVELNLQIEALQSQIEQEQARLASPEGTTLNVTVEETSGCSLPPSLPMMSITPRWSPWRRAGLRLRA
jgi:hypothetical protein